MTTFIYLIVLPSCAVFAFKRIPLHDLRWNTLLWAIPFLIAEYVLLSDSATGSQLAFALLSLLGIFSVAVYAASRLEDWLNHRS